MAIESTDEVLINRNGVTYTQTQGEIMAKIETTDLMLVNREDVTYTVTGEEFIDSVIDPLTIEITFGPNPPICEQDCTVTGIPLGGKAPYTYDSYQWYVSDLSDGGFGVAIPGADTSVYTIPFGSEGKYFGCRITVTDARGTSATQTSYAQAAKIVEIAPVIDTVTLTEAAGNAEPWNSASYDVAITKSQGTQPLTNSIRPYVKGSLSSVIDTDLITDIEGGGSDVYATDTIASVQSFNPPTTGGTGNDQVFRANQTYPYVQNGHPYSEAAVVTYFFDEPISGELRWSSDGSRSQFTNRVLVSSDGGTTTVIAYQDIPRNNNVFYNAGENDATISTLGTHTNINWMQFSITGADSCQPGPVSIGEVVVDVTNNGVSKILTFPSAKDFDKFEVGDVVQGSTNSANIAIEEYDGNTNVFNGLWVDAWPDTNIHFGINAIGKYVTWELPSAGKSLRLTGGPVNQAQYTNFDVFSGSSADDVTNFITSVTNWSSAGMVLNVTLPTDHKFIKFVNTNGGTGFYLVSGSPNTYDGISFYFTESTKITAIDAAGSTITTDGGSWLGADGSGDVSDGRYEPDQQWSSYGLSDGSSDPNAGTWLTVFNGYPTASISSSTNSFIGTGTTWEFPMLFSGSIDFFACGSGSEPGSDYILVLNANGEELTRIECPNARGNAGWLGTQTVSNAAYFRLSGGAYGGTRLQAVRLNDKELVDSSIPGGKGDTSISKDAPYGNKLTFASDGNLSNFQPGFDVKMSGEKTIQTSTIASVASVFGWDQSFVWSNSITFTGLNGGMGTGFGTNSPGTAAFNGQVVGNANAAQLGYNNPNTDSIALAEVLFTLFDSATTVKVNFYGMGSGDGRGPLYLKDVTDTWTQITDFPNDGGDTEYTATVNGFRGIRWGAGNGTNNQTVYLNLQGVTVDGKMLVDTGISGNPVTGSNLTFETPNPDLQYFQPGDQVGTDSGFTPVIYTGNGGTQSIKTGFSPDLVWIKQATSPGTEWHALVDTVRGESKYLYSNTTEPESGAQVSGVTLLNDGFEVGSSAYVNDTNGGYVAWCFDAGDTTVTNNDGTIASQVRSNGNFSVVSYSANNLAVQVGHGLLTAPSFILTKPLKADIGWKVYHSGLAGADVNSTDAKDYYLTLNGTNMYTYGADYWGSVGPNNKTFGTKVSGDNAFNDMIAYCWAETPGVSNFGEYGGGSQGKVINCGFEPAFVMIKRYTSADHWIMIDSTRGGTQKLAADTSAPENDVGTVGNGSQNNVEFVSNGFKLTTVDDGTNTGSQRYFYAAFAGSDPVNIIDVDVANNQMTVDGGNWSTGTSTQLNSVEVQGYSSLYYIEVDGVALNDLNYATTITNSAGGAYFNSNKPATNIFDANLTNFAQEENQDGVLWNASSFNLTYQSIKVQCYLQPGSGAKLFINGVDMGVPEGVLGLYGINSDGETKVTGGTYQGTGTVLDVDVTNKQMLLSDVTSRWLEGYRAETLQEVDVAKLYAVLQENTGNIISLTSLLPDFTDQVGASPVTFNFPAVFPSGKTPAATFPFGTELCVDAKLSNPVGSSIALADTTGACLQPGFKKSSGITAVSEIEINPWNQSQVWSSTASLNNVATNVGNDIQSLFDGSLASGPRANSNSTGEINFPSGTISGNVRIYADGTGNLGYKNGNNLLSITPVSKAWNNLGNIDLTYLSFTYDGDGLLFVLGIELDGELLVDTGVSGATTVTSNQLTFADTTGLNAFEAADSVYMCDANGDVASYTPRTSEIASVAGGMTLSSISCNLNDGDSGVMAAIYVDGVLLSSGSSSTYGTTTQGEFYALNQLFSENPAAATYSINGYSTFTFDPPITVNTSLQIMGYKRSNGSTIYVNDVEVPGIINDVLTTVPIEIPIELSFNTPNEDLKFFNAGQTLPALTKSADWDIRATWSDLVSNDVYNGGVFKGETSKSPDSGNVKITFSNLTDATIKSQMRGEITWMMDRDTGPDGGRPNPQNGTVRVSVNGSDYTGQVNQEYGMAKRTINTGSTIINYLEIGLGNGDGKGEFSDLRINGKRLVDPDVPGDTNVVCVSTDIVNNKMVVNSGDWLATDDTQLGDATYRFVDGYPKSGTGTFGSFSGNDVTLSASNLEWIDPPNQAGTTFYMKSDQVTTFMADNPDHVAIFNAFKAAASDTYEEDVNTRRAEIVGAVQRLINGETLDANEAAQVLVNVALGVNAVEPFSYDGYYPLYFTPEKAIAASPQNAYHTHQFAGTDYFMPDGGTMYHGNYVSPEEVEAQHRATNETTYSSATGQTTGGGY